MWVTTYYMDICNSKSRRCFHLKNDPNPDKIMRNEEQKHMDILVKKKPKRRKKTRENREVEDFEM